MSTRTVQAEPCWELEHEADDMELEWHPHYVSRAEAEAELDERPEPSSEPIQRARPCVHLICDGCGDALGFEGEMAETNGVHMDPADVDEALRDDGWGRDVEGRDLCPGCPHPPIDESRIPGPLDVPLFDTTEETR